MSRTADRYAAKQYNFLLLAAFTPKWLWLD